jgi:hypothetical protein
MAVPYHKARPSADGGCAAFLDIENGRDGVILGALLLMDDRGRPLEFVHNRTELADDWMWAGGQRSESGVSAIVHSLYDACRREPDLLACKHTLGTPDFLRREIAPSIPMLMVLPNDDGEIEWQWVNDPPTAGMRAHTLAPQLEARGFLLEPFGRLKTGLRELYPADFEAGEPDDSIP